MGAYRYRRNRAWLAADRYQQKLELRLGRTPARPARRGLLRTLIVAAAGWTGQSSPSPRLLHFEDQLAEILAAEQFQQRLRKCLQTLDNVLARLELAGGDPGGDVARSLRKPIDVVEHHHALHAGAVDEEREIVARALDRRGAVVLRNGPANHHAGMPPQDSEHEVEDIAADIVEIHVHAVWTVRPQALARVSCLVVDRCIETEFVDEVAAFGGASRDSDRAAPLDLCDLADGGADRTGGSGHHDGFARLELAHVQQPEIGGHARHAERVEERRQGCDFGIDLD